MSTSIPFSPHNYANKNHALVNVTNNRGKSSNLKTFNMQKRRPNQQDLRFCDKTVTTQTRECETQIEHLCKSRKQKNNAKHPSQKNSPSEICYSRGNLVPVKIC